MIAFETGAIFKIQDEFSVTLRRLTEQLAKVSGLTKGITEGFAGMSAGAEKATTAASAAFGKLNESIEAITGTMKTEFGEAFAGFGTAADAATSVAVTSMERFDASIAASMASLRGLKTEMATVGAVGAGSANIMALGGSGRSHPRPGGPHFDRVGSEIPGGHISMGGTPALAAAGVLGYGIYEAAQLQSEIAKMMITGQVKPEAYGVTSDRMGRIIMDASSSTGFSASEVGEALMKGERSLQGMTLDKKLATTQTLMPYAATEAIMKNTSLAEAMESFIAMAHMTGEYDPGKLGKLASNFAFASLATNSSLPQLKNTLSYSMPELRATMGVDPGTIMALTTVAQNAGITSTKSGTWLRSFFENIEPENGPGKSAKVHNSALRKLGLLDDDNKAIWRVHNPDGSTDWNASVVGMSSTLRDHLAAMPEDDRIGAVRGVLGERGGAMGSMLSMKTFVEQFAMQADKMKSFEAGSAAIQDYTNNSTAQKARETWRDTQNLLIDLGNTALPTVNKALTSLDVILKQLPADWEATKKMWGVGAGSGTPSVPGQDENALHRHDEMPARKSGGGWFGGLFQHTAFTDGGDFSGIGAGPLADATFNGFLRAFRAISTGAAGFPGGGDAGGGGLINASYTTFGGGNAAVARAIGSGAIGRGTAGGNFGSIGDGSVLSRAFGLEHAGEGQAAKALGHIMHAGEWCADFVNGVIAKAGGHGSGSAMARSFMGWGHAVGLASVKGGDVAVLNGGGHVGFFTGEHDKNGRLGVIAGNTRDGHGGHEVRHYFVNPGQVFGARRGDEGYFIPPAQKPSVVVHSPPIHLDGKIIAQSTTHHIMAANEFTHSHSFHDDSRHFMPPDGAFG